MNNKPLPAAELKALLILKANAVDFSRELHQAMQKSRTKLIVRHGVEKYTNQYLALTEGLKVKRIAYGNVILANLK